MNIDVAIDQLLELVTQIREASYADDKTALGNALALSKEIDSIGAGTSDLDVVVFADLNDFKHLNDTHGHDAGDVAIRQVGDYIRSEFVDDEKLNAKAFRVSGDEFVILLKQDLVDLFQTKTPSFGSVKFRYEEKALEAKMSFGFVVGDRKTDFTELKKRAETACLAAKREGDGTCIEWNAEVERNAWVELRRKCTACHSLNKCSVSKQASNAGLQLCAFCGIRFET